MEGNNFERQIWRSQEVEGAIDTGQTCRLARKREIRGAIAYWSLLACTLLAVVGFIRNLVALREAWVLAGTAWALVAVCVIGWSLLRSGPGRRRRGEPCAQFLIRALEGKRCGVLGIRWLAPLLMPAIVACWVGGGPTLGAVGFGVRSPAALYFLGSPYLLVAFAAMLAFVWFAFTRLGRKLGMERDHIRAQMGN